MIRIDDIKFDENNYGLFIRFLRKTTGIELDYYQRRLLESRFNLGGLILTLKTESILSSQSNLKLVDSLNRIYMKNNCK
ncbi:MAG: hypothetical protein ACFFD7_04125 [Candidatus Thorarchaeota archaeon]